MTTQSDQHRFFPSAKTGILLLLYGCIVGGVFVSIGLFLANHHADLQAAIIRFFLPEDWVFVGEYLFERFIDGQSIVVLVNAAVSGAVVGVSALTFLLKEKISLSYEKDTDCAVDYVHREPPLWVQGYEEIKLVIFYIAMTLLVLRLGVSSEDWHKQFATIGSYLVLATTMVMDFTSPILMRHGARYVDVARAALRSPVRSLFFGLFFGGIPVAIGRFAVMAEMEPTLAFGLSAVVHLVMLAGAILVGTLLGAGWIPLLTRLKPVQAPIHLSAWLGIIGCLTWNLIFFGSIAQAAYHVSPVLKCEWTPIPDSFKLQPPSLGNPEFGLALDLRIVNPTKRSAKVGENRIELRHDGALLATTRIPEFEVSPGEMTEQQFRLALRPEGGLVRKAVRGLFDAGRDGVWTTLKSAVDANAYSLTLLLPTPAGDFPVKLFDGSGLDP